MRFLWYGNLQEENIIKCRFARVNFGVTSYQFLLNGSVQTHANKHENIDPEFARKVKKYFEMHNLNSGAQSTKKGFIKRSKVDFQKQVSISEISESGYQ